MDCPIDCQQEDADAKECSRYAKSGDLRLRQCTHAIDEVFENGLKVYLRVLTTTRRDQ